MLQTVFSVSSFSPSEEDIERKKEKICPFALCLKSQIAGLDHTGVLASMATGTCLNAGGNSKRRLSLPEQQRKGVSDIS